MVYRPAGKRFVVCIPTYLEAKNIEKATRMVDRAISSSQYRDDCLLVNVDNNSPDGTSEIFATTPTRTARHVLACGDSRAGKGRNLFSLFEFCAEIGAAGALTIDADLEQVSEEWINRFLDEVEHVDMVLPVYPRRWYEGSLTNQVVAPLILAETGNAIRQPVAGEFAFSQNFMKRVRTVPWPEEAWTYGVDVFLTMTAAGGAGIKQVGLSTGKVQPWRSRSVAGVEREFPPKFRQVVNTLLACLRVAAPGDQRSVRFPPTTTEAVFETEDCDLNFMKEVASRAASRVRGTPEWADLGIDPSGEMSDASWARVLNHVLRWSRSGRLSDDRMAAFCAAFFVRIAHVQPELRGRSQAEIDKHVWNVGSAVKNHGRGAIA